ncbi:MAG: NAD(P)H-dependent oxidoreductase subunit E [Thermovirgaceae bacterium]|jgi:predicted metal-binding protein|nr:NAD(P)H-dependent oxidoreductase subunit E [Synergistota bacterium]HOP51735.1 NAD(P)H-dependent oxidoreductase subunit E [Synergistales bacterium]
MKKPVIFIALLFILGLVAFAISDPLWAGQPEKLYVCGPCSSFFLEDAKSVVEELGVSDLVSVRRSSCLGACAQPPVIEFRGTVYVEMTAERLRSMLECELGIL